MDDVAAGGARGLQKAQTKTFALCCEISWGRQADVPVPASQRVINLKHRSRSSCALFRDEQFPCLQLPVHDGCSVSKFYLK